MQIGGLTFRRFGGREFSIPGGRSWLTTGRRANVRFLPATLSLSGRTAHLAPTISPGAGGICRDDPQTGLDLRPGSLTSASARSFRYRKVDPILINHLRESVILNQGRCKAWSKGHGVVPPARLLLRWITGQHHSTEGMVAQPFQKRLLKAGDA